MFSLADKYYSKNKLYRGQEVLKVSFPAAQTTTNEKYLRVWEQQIGTGPVSLFHLLSDLQENSLLRISVANLSDIIGASVSKTRTWLEILEENHFIIRFRYVVGKRELTPLIIVRDCIPILGKDELAGLHPHWQQLHNEITSKKGSDNTAPYKVSENRLRRNLDPSINKKISDPTVKQCNTVQIDDYKIKRIETLCWLCSAIYPDKVTLHQIVEEGLKEYGHPKFLELINAELDHLIVPLQEKAKTTVNVGLKRKDLVKLLVDLGQGSAGAQVISRVIESLNNFKGIRVPMAAIRAAALSGKVYNLPGRKENTANKIQDEYKELFRAPQMGKHINFI